MTTSGDYKLYYWNKRGRGEQVRLLFHAMGVDYEDAYLDKAAFIEIRTATPEMLYFGSVPMLEHGSFRLSQGPAILSYLARGHGFAPEGPELAAKADAIVLGAEDLRCRYFGLFGGDDSADRQAAFVSGDWADRWLPCFDRLLADNEGDWFLGSSMSHADVAVWDVLDSMTTWIEGASLDDFARLSGFFSRFRETPAIARYLSSDRRAAG